MAVHLTIKEAFCRRFSCSEEEFREKMFWQALYLHAKIPALLLWKNRATFFKEDFELIEEISTVSSSEIFRMEINRFYGRNKRDKNYFRRCFALRLSGKKLFKVKNGLQGLGE